VVCQRIIRLWRRIEERHVCKKSNAMETIEVLFEDIEIWIEVYVPIMALRMLQERQNRDSSDLIGLTVCCGKHRCHHKQSALALTQRVLTTRDSWP